MGDVSVLLVCINELYTVMVLRVVTHKPRQCLSTRQAGWCTRGGVQGRLEARVPRSCNFFLEVGCEDRGVDSLCLTVCMFSHTRTHFRCRPPRPESLGVPPTSVSVIHRVCIEGSAAAGTEHIHNNRQCLLKVPAKSALRVRCLEAVQETRRCAHSESDVCTCLLPVCWRVGCLWLLVGSVQHAPGFQPEQAPQTVLQPMQRRRSLEDILLQRYRVFVAKTQTLVGNPARPALLQQQDGRSTHQEKQL